MADIRRSNFSKTLIKPLAICMSLILLTACAQKEESNSSEGSGLALPQLVQRMTIPSGGTLSATVTIDKGSSNASTHDMQVDTTNNRLSFSEKVTTGTHSFFIELFYRSSSINKIRLVSATRTVHVASDQSINFNDGEFIYDDQDIDGFTNIVEIESGSDPFAESSKPDPSIADDNYEPNRNWISAYDITSLKGVWFNDDIKTNTGSGRLSTHDGSDLFKFTIDTNTTSSFEIRANSQFGVFWRVIYPTNGVNDSEYITVTPETVDSVEKETYFDQTVEYTNLQDRDYYLWFYTEADDQIDGFYYFGWY